MPAMAVGVRPALVVGAVLALAALCVRAGSPGMGVVALGACALTWALCPMVAALAMRWGAFVRPGGRSVHATPIPLLGGLALYVPIVCTLLWAGGPHAAALIVGSTVVLLAGGWDDLRGLTPRRKIAAQAVAALVLVADGYRITGLRIDPLGTLSIGGFESAAVVAWIILTTNAINLIDGSDGLAATIALVAALAHAALGFPLPLALALAGACLGFLRHNLPCARVFLGDTGSLLLGFCLGALPLAAPGPLNLPVAVGLLAIPLGDVALCAARRWLRAKPLCAPDRGHLHHVLLRLWGYSPPRVLLGLGTLAAAQAVAVCLQPNLWGLLAAGCLLAGTVVYVLSRIRPDWPRILLHRHAFRRIHLARNYARGALQICEGRDEVRDVLQRVVEDLALCGAELRGMRVERKPLPATGQRVVEERVDCGDATASWSAAAEQDDPPLMEEKRIVMCDVLREASKRLRCCAPAAPPIPAPSPRGHAAIHCVVEDLAQLERVATLVPAMRQQGAARAIVVFPGRHDDLGLAGAGLDGLLAHVICLDLPPEPDRDLLAESVGARYLALLGHERPAATVVVGDGSVASACATAASAFGIDVVRFDTPGNPPEVRVRAAGNGAGAGNGGPKRGSRPFPGRDVAIRVIPALQCAPPERASARIAEQQRARTDGMDPPIPAGEEAPCSP